MYILGISCFYHDAAAALLHDGQIVAAAEEERFTRIKGDSAFPRQAIHFCLESAGITAQDLDYVVFYEKPLLKFERILYSALATVPRSAGLFREAMVTWFSEKLWMKALLVRELDLPPQRVLFADHHLSHAASAFFCSPYTEAAILTLDGVGEWTTTATGYATADWGQPGTHNQIVLDQEVRFPHSLGLLYSAFTAWLGFVVNNGEYKVMGMSPYGQPRYLDKVEKVLRLANDGSFALNMDYFSFHTSTEETFNRRFVALFGEPRDPKSEFITDLTHPNGAGGGDKALRARNQHYADVAMSIQRTTEEAILRMVRHLHSTTGSENLCIAGGVALNSVANGRIVREGPFKNVYIQPSAGDSGGAVGAALCAWHVLLGKPRRFVMDHAYWGAEYAPGEIVSFLRAKGLPYREVSDDRLIAEITDDLTAGRVIGWFQGRMEFGPRALGGRSILGDARSPSMQSVLNLKVKYRESFRPFAPSVLREEVAEWFDIDADSPYMLLVAGVRPQHRRAMTAEEEALFGIDKLNVPRSEIPAVTHVDYSARIQTVDAATNPRYHALISAFTARTGCPVVVNTSFNVRGEPIVGSPEDAFRCFMGCEIERLAVGNCYLVKDAQDPALKLDYKDAFDLD